MACCIVLVWLRSLCESKCARRRCVRRAYTRPTFDRPIRAPFIVVPHAFGFTVTLPSPLCLFLAPLLYGLRGEHLILRSLRMYCVLEQSTQTHTRIHHGNSHRTKFHSEPFSLFFVSGHTFVWIGLSEMRTWNVTVQNFHSCVRGAVCAKIKGFPFDADFSRRACIAPYGLFCISLFVSPTTCSAIIIYSNSHSSTNILLCQPIRATLAWTLCS